MSDYGLKINNNKIQIVTEDVANLGIKIDHATEVYNAYSGWSINFSGLNNTKNIDVVWNSNDYVSPYARCVTGGLLTVFNRFWYNHNALLSANIIGVGVGNEVPKTQSYGTYLLDSRGVQIINSQNRMLKLVGQYAGVQNINYPSGVVLDRYTTWDGWLWSMSIDVSDLPWSGPYRWFSVTPLRAKVMFSPGEFVLRVATIFRMTGNTFEVGEWISAQTGPFQILSTNEQLLVNIMFFSEGN